MDASPKPHTRFRTIAIVFVALLVIGVAFRLTEAGSLMPAGVPADDSMPSLASISDALVGTTFDSSGIAADPDGNAFEITKCIIEKLTGGTCP